MFQARAFTLLYKTQGLCSTACEWLSCVGLTWTSEGLHVTYFMLLQMQMQR